MKKRLAIWASLLIAAALALGLIPREDPVEYVYREFPLTQGWGNMKVERITESDEVVTLEVIYDADKNFLAHERWFIKDRTKLQDLPGGYYEKWHGYVYLVKDGLYSWEAVQ